MGKPTKQRGRWRIRWFDQDGHRQSEVYDDHRDASFKLREHQQEVATGKVEVTQKRLAPRIAPW